jgi:hypothetical protein
MDTKHRAPVACAAACLTLLASAATAGCGSQSPNSPAVSDYTASTSSTASLPANLSLDQLLAAVKADAGGAQLRSDGVVLVGLTNRDGRNNDEGDEVIVGLLPNATSADLRDVTDYLGSRYDLHRIVVERQAGIPGTA